MAETRNRPGKLTPKQEAEAIAMYVAGDPQYKIGKHFGKTQQTISQIFSKDHIKKHIQDAQTEITIRNLTPALDNIHWLITNYREFEKDADGNFKLNKFGQKIPVLPKEMLNHAWDAHKELLKSTGISPYPTDSKLVQYVYQDNRQVFMSPVMQEALNNYAKSLKLPDSGENGQSEDENEESEPIEAELVESGG